MGIPEKALMTGDDIKLLIPQREPVMMIDKFYGITDDISYSGLTVKADNIFVENEHLSEAGLIEHMAQSAAARAGYISFANKRPVALGFIGSINKCKIVTLPKINDKLYTSVKVETEIFGVLLIRSEVFVGENRVAECMMKISLQNAD